MAQQLKPRIPLASHTGLLLQVLAAPILIQFPASTPGKAVEDGPNASTDVRDWDRVPDSWLLLASL